MVMDAVLAVITLEHGATFCTTGRDFSRFPGITSTIPRSGTASPQCSS
jgi:predicted nucleic acid-binding protein